MNTYKKYYPNVFAAQCKEEHTKGEVIVITTKYGKEIENEVHNYLGKTKEGFYLYSVTRIDGPNSQTRAQSKMDKLNGYAINAEKRATAFYEASQEGKDFLSLGEPIKIGHHSERRHRRLIERNWRRLGKSVEETEKAKDYQRRAEYWEERAKKIDLSMPESLAFFEFELEKAKKHHLDLKENPEKRRHSMSLQYANKAVKDIQEKVKMAIRLWGDEEDIKQMESEEKAQAENKASKDKKKKDAIKQYGGFFAFSSDQFIEGYNKAKQNGYISEGEKVTHIGMGLYIPKSNIDSFLKEYKR